MSFLWEHPFASDLQISLFPLTFKERRQPCLCIFSAHVQSTSAQSDFRRSRWTFRDPRRGILMESNIGLNVRQRNRVSRQKLLFCKVMSVVVECSEINFTGMFIAHVRVTSHECLGVSNHKQLYCFVQHLQANTTTPRGRLNKKDGLTRYGDSHVKDKTS